MLSVSLQITNLQFNVVHTSADCHPAIQCHPYLCRSPPCNSTLSISLQIATLQFDVICISVDRAMLSVSLQIFKPLMSPLLSPDTVSKHPIRHLHERVQQDGKLLRFICSVSNPRAISVSPMEEAELKRKNGDIPADITEEQAAKDAQQVHCTCPLPSLCIATCTLPRPCSAHVPYPGFALHMYLTQAVHFTCT